MMPKEEAQDLNASMLDIFNEEVVELTQEWTHWMSEWEKEITNLAPLKEMKRVLHTLKGSARMLKLTNIADFCHKLEDVLVQIDDEKYHASTPENKQLLEVCRLAITQAASTLFQPVSSQASPSESNFVSDKIKLTIATVETLSKLASSANITRAHLEQQQHLLADYYDRLKQTLLLLQDQVRDKDNPILKKITSDLFEIMYTMSLVLNLQEEQLRTQQRATSDLEENLTRVRMVSFDYLVPRLEKMSMQVAQELGKELRFQVVEMSGEMDRSVLERLMTPLGHLLRNAIDHGIESPEERLAKGKPRAGVIELSLVRNGAWVTITIRDDGRGLDAQKIREKAISLGHLDSDRILSDEALYSYILMPGFSMSEKITQISGRGIGMDVVNNEVKKLGGHLFIDSIPHEETVFTIELPFTVSLNQALIFEMKDQLFGVLLSNISGITRISASELKELLSTHCPLVESEQEYHLHYLGQMLKFSNFETLYESIYHKSEPYLPVLLMKMEHACFALIVDKIIGFREVVVKSLGRQLVAVPEVLGGSILGDGSLVLVLDAYALTQKQKHPSLKQAPCFKILMVDDSATIRKAVRTFLEKHRYKVHEAQDGLIALEYLKTTVPDVVLLDMEMPNMGGIEVIQNMRLDPRLANVPIVVITTLPTENYEQKVMEAGANYFLNKPATESVLIELLNKILS